MTTQNNLNSFDHISVSLVWFFQKINVKNMPLLHLFFHISIDFTMKDFSCTVLLSYKLSSFVMD